jgi:putative Mn2+ efflux pump MntP
MNFFTTLLISIGLAMDCFAVSMCAATINVKQDLRYRFRIAWHFGLFQAMFALIGYLTGSTIANWIANFDHWVAFILLAWISIKMIKDGLNPDPDACPTDPSRGKTLILFSIATSIDAMAVGLSLGLLGSDILLTSLLIGITSIAFSVLGLFLGQKLGFIFGKRMEIFGGSVLALIGIRILIDWDSNSH